MEIVNNNEEINLLQTIIKDHKDSIMTIKIHKETNKDTIIDHLTNIHNNKDNKILIMVEIGSIKIRDNHLKIDLIEIETMINIIKILKDLTKTLDSNHYLNNDSNDNNYLLNSNRNKGNKGEFKCQNN